MSAGAIEERSDVFKIDLPIDEGFADASGEDESGAAAFALLVPLHLRGEARAFAGEIQGPETRG